MPPANQNERPREGTSRVYTARGPAPGEDWTAVAEAVNARMAGRRIGQQQLAELSGVSVSTIRLVQHGAGRRVQNKTLAALARALGWPDDHLVRLLLARQAAVNQDNAAGGTLEEQILAALFRIERRLADIDARLGHPATGRATGKAADADRPGEAGR